VSDSIEDRSQQFGNIIDDPLTGQDAGAGEATPPANGKPNAKKSGATKVEKPQMISITLDRTNEQVLQFNMDEGLELVWDEDSFRELPEEVERQLRHANLKNYLKVQFQVKQKAEKAAGLVKIDNPLNPLGMNTEFRLRIRARRGWHQCWKTPGNELDAALAGPYKQIRKQKDTGRKDQYGEAILEKQEPGYENGEVLKLMDENGKVELVAVECPLELYDKYLEYMAEKSRRMYSANKNKFAENVEELNRKLDKDKRMKVIDEGGTYS